MALSGSYNYYTTRDDIIKRAMRIIGALSQGETPTTTAVTEAAITLNEIFKEWQADGMQLWRRSFFALSSFTTGAVNCTIGMSGATQTTAPPKKLLQAYYRNNDTSIDTPITLITRQEYNMLSPAASTGPVTQIYYRAPRQNDSSVNSGNYQGTCFFVPTPTTAWLADNVIWIEGILPLQDFDSATDNPDIPDYLVNALVWALADQLSYEYGVGLAERSMVTKKAQFHKAVALSYDQEEGSIFIMPEPRWEE